MGYFIRKRGADMPAKRLYDPATTYNIDDFLKMQNLDTATYYNFSILEVYNGVEHLYWNLIDDYVEDLEVVKVKLDDNQFNKYKYHPDLLAYDVYGSTQLDFVVLAVNDMIDPKDFNRPNIYLPFATAMTNFLDKIGDANTKLLKYNRLDNGIRTLG